MYVRPSLSVTMLFTRRLRPLLLPKVFVLSIVIVRSNRVKMSRPIC